MEKKKGTGASSVETKRRGRPATGLTQKHFSFRCDIENLEYLETKENKGGFINRLLRAAAQQEGWRIDAEDIGPERGDEE